MLIINRNTEEHRQKKRCSSQKCPYIYVRKNILIYRNTGTPEHRINRSCALPSFSRAPYNCFFEIFELLKFFIFMILFIGVPVFWCSKTHLCNCTSIIYIRNTPYQEWCFSGVPMFFLAKNSRSNSRTDECF